MKKCWWFKVVTSNFNLKAPRHRNGLYLTRVGEYRGHVTNFNRSRSEHTHSSTIYYVICKVKASTIILSIL
jgi:hypothetical protein